MKVIVALVALLAVGLAALGLQNMRLNNAESQRDMAEQRASNQGAVINELLAHLADVNEVRAALKVREQERNLEGERRREQIKETIKDDQIAAALVPAAIADGLRARAAEVDAADRLRASPGGFDRTQ